jgi:hypothetical protein
MKNTYLILVTLLFAGAMSKITPTGVIQKHSLLQGDFFYSDLNNYFDFSEVSYPITVTGNNAIANNQTEAYQQKHF